MTEINLLMHKIQVVGILTFISMINKTSESLKARKVFYFSAFKFYEELKFSAQLFYNLGP